MELKMGRGRQRVHDIRERRRKKSHSEAEQNTGKRVRRRLKPNEGNISFFFTFSVFQLLFHTGNLTPASVTYTHLSVTFS